MKEKKFIKLTPFKMQVLQSFPFIDADFDAITNYELLCKVVEYLNTTVDNVNLLESDFKVLYDYVHDYFENLDVQEEINNKLDAMAEAGTLTDIIAQYLGLAGMLTYNTVADMKAAENLADGSTCQTLGYNAINDNGSAIYKVRPITNEDTVDEISIIALYDVSLVAELILKPAMYVECFGAKGDGITDDKTKIQNAIDLCSIKNIKLLFSNKTYYISNSVNIKSNLKISGTQNSKIHCLEYTNTGNQPIFNFDNVTNIEISDLELYSVNNQTDSRSQLTSNRNAFQLNNSHDIMIKNCKGNYLHSFIWISQTSENECYNIDIDSCETYETHEPVYMNYSKNIHLSNLITSQCDDSSNLSHHLYINGKCENITVYNWEVKKCPNKDYGYIINISDSNSTGYVPNNIVIDNMHCYETATCSFLALTNDTEHGLGKIKISNCYITKPVDKNYGGSHKRLVFYGGKSYQLFLDNCVFIGYTNFGELNGRNDNLDNKAIINDCYFYFSGTITYDFESSTEEMIFNNCKFNYDIDGNFKIINKNGSSPYIKRFLFKNCLFNILTTATWIISVSDRYSHVDFVDCTLMNNNITSGYFLANSGANTADNVSFTNSTLIGYDSDNHGGTSSRTNNKFKLDVTIE